jgi:hypothetical protein
MSLEIICQTSVAIRIVHCLVATQAKTSKVCVHCYRSAIKALYSTSQVLSLPERVPFIKSFPTSDDASYGADYPARRVGSDGPIHLRCFLSDDRLQVTFAMPDEHPFWAITDVEEWYRYMEAALPQCDHLRVAMPPDNVRTFLDARLDHFPVVQHSRALAQMYSDAGVVLLGDACHAFPSGPYASHTPVRRVGVARSPCQC